MAQPASHYGRRFDAVMVVPLLGYLVLVCALIVALFWHVTTAALATALHDPALRDAVVLSLETSAASTILSMLVAVPAGYVLSRREFPGRLVVDTVLDLPIVLPPLVMGLCILIFFNTPWGRWLDRGLVPRGLFVYQPLGIVFVQFVVGCAFAVRVVKAGFDALDPRFEEVAMTLGAGPWQTFVQVTLPGVRASLVAGAVICWARIFGLFGPILLVCGTMRGRTEIMPTTIYLETSIGRLEVALVIGAGMVLISLGALLAFKRLGGKGYLW